MNVFLLPKNLIREIESVMNAFWWKGAAREGKGICWKSWSNLCIPKPWGGLGFRSLRGFNLALLCKQAWRLIDNPLSLAARVIKQRYYPNSSFMDAAKGQNPSFIWSSLMETREIIRKNTRWRIGNGNHTKIWHDNWLPDRSNPRVVTPPFPYLEDDQVSSLINRHTNDWDAEAINDIFHPRDTNLILSIPLSTQDRNDKLIWAKEDNGNFSVKSCYKAIMGELPEDTKLDWSFIWNLKIPPRAKIFIWQVCSNIVPTADRLRTKKVDCPSICQVCNAAEETILHILAECKPAKEAWTFFNNMIDASPTHTATDWFMKMVRQIHKSQISCFTMICWNLWAARNDKVWNNISSNGISIVHKTRSFLHDWSQLNFSSTQHSNSNMPSVKWTKPSPGFLKLNTDAALDKSKGKMGFGWVLRDEHGTFVAASCMPKDGLCAPKEAEAMAIREALSWLKNNNYSRVKIESDALTVIQSLKSEIFNSSFDLILLDVKDLLCHLDDVFIAHIKRSANGVAHLLARYSTSNADRKDWFLEPPSFICNALYSDV